MSELYNIILDDIEQLKTDVKNYKKERYTYRSGTVCSKCGCINCPTVDSRPIDGFQQRRRKCNNCGYKWNTIEIKI